SRPSVLGKVAALGRAYTERARGRVARKSKVVAFAVLAVAGALVSLFGDPRVTPVTHPLSARMLLRALGMNETVKRSGEASALFAVLAGRDSRVFAADGFERMDGLVPSREGSVRRLSAVTETGQGRYAGSIVHGGDR